MYLLARGVKGRGGLVEKKDGGLLDDSARDGDALLLSAGELAAAEANLQRDVNQDTV